MIELLIAVNIYMVSDVKLESGMCKSSTNVIGCYVYGRQKGGEIYVDKDMSYNEQLHTMYHEMGHLFFVKKRPKLFKDDEVIAEQFAWWIRSTDYPILSFTLSKQEIEFFNSKCNQICVDTVKAIAHSHIN